MYSVYFVVSEHSLSDRIRSVIDFPRFDLQYFGTEYHSALALRLAIVAKPQIIVLDSDAPFISVSKCGSILRENDVNCVLILLEGSDARHKPCPGIAAIRLDRNDLSPQRVQDAFRHAIAMADSRSAIRLTVSSPHQMPDDLLAYLQSGGPLTPARLALLFPRTQWVNYKHTQATAARSVGVSASYLCAVLKKSLGMTYIDLLTNVRIYHAKRLLAEDPTQRIHQVAAMAGFDDQRYFSKVFRRAAGCTPQQYAASIPRKEVPSP